MIRLVSSVKIGATLVMVLGLGIVGTGTAIALPNGQTQAVSPDIDPKVSNANTNCPAGVDVVVPDPAAVTKYGGKAIVKKETQDSDPSLANSPALAKIAALNPVWLDHIDCAPSPVATSKKAFQTLPATDSDKSASASQASVTPKSVTSPNWSGYVYQGMDYDHAYYAQVSMTWTVPGTHAPRDGGIDDVSIWPGIGNGSDTYNSLIQAGSESYSGPGVGGVGASGTFGWYEKYPEQTEQIIQNLHVDAGDAMSVVVSADIKNNLYYTLCAVYPKPSPYPYASSCVNIHDTLKGSNNEFPGSQQAEFIVERALAGNYDKLLQFPLLHISGAGGQYEYGSGLRADPFTLGATSALGSYLQKWTMTSCNKSQTLASPSAINNAGFNVTWKQPGDFEKC